MHNPPFSVGLETSHGRVVRLHTLLLHKCLKKIVVKNGLLKPSWFKHTLCRLYNIVSQSAVLLVTELISEKRYI